MAINDVETNLQTGCPAVIANLLHAHNRANICHGRITSILHNIDNNIDILDQIPLQHHFNQTGSSAIPQGDGNPQHKDKALGWFRLKAKAV